MVFWCHGRGSTVGLLVEDRHYGALRELARRVLQTAGGAQIDARVLGRGDLLKASKVVAHTIGLWRLHRNLRKVVACIDCEEYPIGHVQADVSRVLSEVRKMAPPLIPDYVIVLHALESWTGADEDALRASLRVGNRTRIRAIAASDQRPKEALRQLFQRHGQNFLGQKHNLALAKIVTLETLRTKNPSFVEFEQKVLDP